MKMNKNLNTTISDFCNHDCDTCINSFFCQYDRQHKTKKHGEMYEMKRIETPKFDITKYVGTKTQIAKAEIIKSKFGYAIKVESMPIKLIGGDRLPDGKILRASIILGFVLNNEDGSWCIGKDSNLDNFLTGHKIDASSIPDNIKSGELIRAFEGLPVVCQKSKTGYLEIA